MKKLFFFAIAALGMTAACQKPDTNLVDDSNEPVAIQFGMKATTVSVTKTKAPVEAWTDENNKIHVVGYNYHTKELLWVETGVPAAAGATATLDFGKHLYYNSNYAYDFRAYYLGDGEPAAALSLNVPVTITGQEDVMAGVTNRAEDLAKKDGDKNVTNAQMYSAFAARRGVHPSLTFNHMLTRLNVTVEYPSNRAEVPDDLLVALEKLTVTSNTTGILSLDGDTPAIALDKDPKELSIEIAGNNTGVVMIQPDLTEINFTFDLVAEAFSQPGQKVTLKASDVKDAAEATTKFQAGKEYNVTIKVYDLEEIVVSATVSEWGEGGNVTYDPDDDSWTPDVYTGN